jgi:hypothetical protein
VPRECNGKFIEDAMMLVPDNWTSHHYQDLFRQKQDYLQQFLTQYGRSADDSVFQLDPTKLSTQVRFLFKYHCALIVIHSIGNQR